MTLREQLLDDWRRHRNPLALRTLLEALPPELPPAVVRRERDRRLRELSNPLLRVYRPKRVAIIMAELGAAAEAGRPPRLTGIDPSLRAEVALAQREIARLLEFLPTRAGGRRWLTQRQLFDIIARCSRAG